MRILAHIHAHADNGVASTPKSPGFLPFGVWSSQNWALFVWRYALAWFLANDCVKLLACRMPLAALKG